VRELKFVEDVVNTRLSLLGSVRKNRRDFSRSQNIAELPRGQS